jgi:DNA-binding LacI/PurR family transcriptional regulator
MAATLKEIADVSGTSVRSVTRALKGQPGLSAEKRLAIVQIAKDLGYVPNIAARNLRMRQSNFIGIVVPMTQHEVHQRRLADLQTRLEVEGMFPLMGNLCKPKELHQMLREWTGIVNTVIFLAWDRKLNSESLLKGFNQNYIFIDCEGGMNQRDITISVDRQAGIKQGIAQLVASGCQRIAYCGCNMPNRMSGFNSALEAVNSDKTKKLFIKTKQIDFADGYQVAPEIMQSQADAVFFITDRLAMGFLKYAYEHNIRIPDDIAVIGFDDDQPGRYSCPALSSVAHPISEINKKIIELIVTKNFMTKEFSYKTVYIQRESS